MSEALTDILAIVAAAVSTAAATAALAYLLVLAPHQPLYAVLSVLLFASFILVLYLGFVKTPTATPPPPPRPLPPPPQPAAAPTPRAVPSLETEVFIARLETKSGRIIPITSIRQTFGRKDLEGLVDPPLARAISREHFTIFYDFKAGKFFIEDKSSTNGTLLNGADIRGKGPVELKEGDVISPAGILHLMFKIR